MRYHRTYLRLYLIKIYFVTITVLVFWVFDKQTYVYEKLRNDCEYLLRTITAIRVSQSCYTIY